MPQAYSCRRTRSAPGGEGLVVEEGLGGEEELVVLQAEKSKFLVVKKNS
jgi:hypothetical protein